METNSDPFDLLRFVQAQQSNYENALAEIKAGRKRTHWSWYVFPQVAGLGSSPMSVRYAVSEVREAKAYLAHPVLGERLRECVAAMLSNSATSAASILGNIDALKFRSCLTLFAQAEPGAIFREALLQFFGGTEDQSTLAILAQQAGKSEA
ncbi:DUF1810 domain-containing protein [Aquabacterium sp.]|uniref:DUF1810 domain-containing protein n=1 Tax=Aquabacterium sp. TaxID=1872578 RepID=UPI003782D5E0